MKKILTVFGLMLIIFSNELLALKSPEPNVYISLDPELCKLESDDPKYQQLSTESEGFPGLFLYLMKKTYGADCKDNKTIIVNGAITQQTYEKIKFGIELMKLSLKDGEQLSNAKLMINSQGGLIKEAMKIGERISEASMSVETFIDGECSSACVLILAAGIRRRGLGKVGIHRPFASEISTTGLGYKDYLKEYESLTPILKTYLNKFGVSPLLVDEMNAISSDNIKYLTYEDRERFGLGVTNIAYSEFRKARQIEICGMPYYELSQMYAKKLADCFIENDQLFKKDHAKRLTFCRVVIEEDFPTYKDDKKVCWEKYKKAGINK